MKKPMIALFLTERIANLIIELIETNPETPVTANALVEFSKEQLSKGNAAKNISSLKKLGILDSAGRLTKLGEEWAFGHSRKQATDKIIESFFPEGVIDHISESGSSEHLAAWLEEHSTASKEAAKKSAAALRTLLSMCEQPKISNAVVQKEETFVGKGQTEQKPTIVKESSRRPLVRVPLGKSKEWVQEAIDFAVKNGLDIEFI